MKTYIVSKLDYNIINMYTFFHKTDYYLKGHGRSHKALLAKFVIGIAHSFINRF